MAILFKDGFDMYAASALSVDLGMRWNVSQTGVTNRFTFPAGRHGGSTKCVEFSTGGSAFALTKGFSSRASIRASFYLNLPNPLPSGYSICTGYEAGSSHMYVQANTNGTLTFFKNTGSPDALATSSISLRLDTWYKIDVLFTCDNSIPADSCIVRVNGVQVINVPAGSDSRNGNAFGLLDAFSLGRVGINVSGLKFDDFILYEEADPWFDDYRVDSLIANGNGATSQYVGSDADSTDNYLHVDDLTPDGDTTYVESSTIGDVDLYDLANLPTSANIVYGVGPVSICKKDDSGTRTVKPVIRTGGVDFDGSEHIPGTVYGADEGSIWTTNPDTALPWTTSDINTLQAGQKVFS